MTNQIPDQNKQLQTYRMITFPLTVCTIDTTAIKQQNKQNELTNNPQPTTHKIPQDTQKKEMRVDFKLMNRNDQFNHDWIRNQPGNFVLKKLSQNFDLEPNVDNLWRSFLTNR